MSWDTNSWNKACLQRKTNCTVTCHTFYHLCDYLHYCQVFIPVYKTCYGAVTAASLIGLVTNCVELLTALIDIISYYTLLWRNTFFLPLLLTTAGRAITVLKGLPFLSPTHDGLIRLFTYLAPATFYGGFKLFVPVYEACIVTKRHICYVTSVISHPSSVSSF